ncbi:MAG: DUF547 domain-containing protein [Salibacteraceae bacterium]
MKRLIYTGLAVFAFAACSNPASTTNSEASEEKPAMETQAEEGTETQAETMARTLADHSIWNDLLQKHVSDAGNVNYKGIQDDQARFEEYLEELRNHPPMEDWEAGDIKAYWINAYNAFTVELILRNYPVKSITDIKDGDNDAWNIPFIELNGREPMTLNAIEKGILLKEYDEPRIHFAVVCASFSCPKLLNRAITSDQLEDQLVAQTKAFLADTKRNQIAADQLEISQIFEWYTGDFTKQGTLIEFLNQYAPVTINADAQLGYMNYDWSLNE